MQQQQQQQYTAVVGGGRRRWWPLAPVTNDDRLTHQRTDGRTGIKTFRHLHVSPTNGRTDGENERTKNRWELTSSLRYVLSIKLKNLFYIASYR